MDANLLIKKRTQITVQKIPNYLVAWPVFHFYPEIKVPEEYILIKSEMFCISQLSGNNGKVWELFSNRQEIAMTKSYNAEKYAIVDLSHFVDVNFTFHKNSPNLWFRLFAFYTMLPYSPPIWWPHYV